VYKDITISEEREAIKEAEPFKQDFSVFIKKLKEDDIKRMTKDITA